MVVAISSFAGGRSAGGVSWRSSLMSFSHSQRMSRTGLPVAQSSALMLIPIEVSPLFVPLPVFAGCRWLVASRT